MIRRRTILAAGAAAIPEAARAQRAARPVRVGVLNDMSGVYADYQGRGSVVAAELAVADFGGRVNGVPSRSSPPTTRTGPTSAPPPPAAGSTWTA